MIKEDGLVTKQVDTARQDLSDKKGFFASILAVAITLLAIVWILYEPTARLLQLSYEPTVHILQVMYGFAIRVMQLIR